MGIKVQVDSEGRRRKSGGQAMVEFALVVTTLFFLVFAILDGSLLLFTVGTARFAAGEGARVAAERGNVANTDQQIVAVIAGTALGTTKLSVVNEIDIFRLTEDGAGNLIVDNAHYNRYHLDGSQIGGISWPASTRNIQNGTSDFAGVTIQYTYYWKSGIFSPAPPVNLSATFLIRLEPQIY